MKEQGLEGLVAKRRDNRNEPGERSGAWAKMRANRSEGFVIGGYTVGGRHFDALIFGYWEGERLMYAARTRSGFTAAVREQLTSGFRGLETHSGERGGGPTAYKAPTSGRGIIFPSESEVLWLVSRRLRSAGAIS